MALTVIILTLWSHLYSPYCNKAKILVHPGYNIHSYYRITVTRNSYATGRFDCAPWLKYLDPLDKPASVVMAFPKKRTKKGGRMRQFRLLFIIEWWLSNTAPSQKIIILLRLSQSLEPLYTWLTILAVNLISNSLCVINCPIFASTFEKKW